VVVVFLTVIAQTTFIAGVIELSVWHELQAVLSHFENAALSLGATPSGKRFEPYSTTAYLNGRLFRQRPLHFFSRLKTTIRLCLLKRL